MEVKPTYIGEQEQCLELRTGCEGAIKCAAPAAPLDEASSLVLDGYARTGVLPLHTPGGPREDTGQLVEDASW